MARRAVQAVAARHAQSVWIISRKRLRPPSSTSARLNSIKTTSGKEIVAERFVFACGPWLPKLFPELLGELIHVTRQEVCLFWCAAGRREF